MFWFVFQLGDKLESSFWDFSKEVGAQMAPEIQGSPHNLNSRSLLQAKLPSLEAMAGVC